MTFQDQNQEPLVQVSKKDLKRLKEESRTLAQTQQELAQLQRQVAFTEAGVDMRHPAAPYFVKGYEGESTADAVRTAWQTVTGTQASNLTADELAEMQRAQQLTSGGGEIPPDRLAERDAKLKSAKNEAEFDRIFEEYGGVRARLM